jgi:hypothetical protein
VTGVAGVTGLTGLTEAIENWPSDELTEAMS